MNRDYEVVEIASLLLDSNSHMNGLRLTTIIKVFAWHPIIIYWHTVGGTTICLTPLDYINTLTLTTIHTLRLLKLLKTNTNRRAAQQDETLLDLGSVGCTGGAWSVYGRHAR